ncbi:hypothetical protein HY768_08865 [candidate division TA06 bacterium]|uniref:Outer membrane protein beta-barrel domain-containing protein n=1 Tax=candidate division TA06 bacterium TaxID=2250710 RepID=A0A933IF66_UNCT6|nr:hypothetical protein [candidate division TA06 bacterium]
MKKYLLPVLCLAVACPTLCAAGFAKNASYAGPLLGFGWHDLMLGGQYEYGVSPYVGVGAIGGFSRKSFDYYWGELSYTYVSLGFQCNYHFTQAKGLDLFAGGVLGYDIVSCSEKYYPGYDWYRGWKASGSAMFIGPIVSANFPVDKKTGIQARLGYPFYLAGGVNFKF